MSDHSGAERMGEVFSLLARNPDERNRELAREVWKIANRVDCTWDQMSCSDEELLALGLIIDTPSELQEEHGRYIAFDDRDLKKKKGRKQARGVSDGP